MSTYLIISIIYILINIICAFSLIFIERREVETTWAWLLILVMLPGIGFILYLCLGQNLSREKIFRDKIVVDANKVKDVKEYIKGSRSKKSIQHYADLVKMNYKDSRSEYTINNDVKTFINGKEKFNALIEDIKKAKKFIHIEYYIFRADEIGKKLIDILGEKAKEGVEVRLLVDGMGSRGIRGKWEKYIKNLGIEFAIFFPGITRLINLRVNYRNHRKIVVIDGKIGYVGGFNVGTEYITGGEKFDFWRDTHLRIQGEAVKELNKRFSLDWDYASSDSISEKIEYFPDTESCGNVSLQIVSSGPDHVDEYIKYNYLKIISGAKKNIYIQSPYLVLDKPMTEALKIAALSGVDIRIMVPDKPDHFFMKWVLSANIGNLIEYGIKFYKYEKGFIHSKTIVADSLISSVGTANFDIRSFKLNFEINSIILDEKIAIENENIFLEDQKDCRLLSIEEYNSRTKGFKICESIIRLVSPIL